MLSISKQTFFPLKMKNDNFNVNGGAFLNSKKNNALSKIPILYVVYQFLK